MNVKLANLLGSNLKYERIMHYNQNLLRLGNNIYLQFHLISNRRGKKNVRGINKNNFFLNGSNFCIGSLMLPNRSTSNSNRSGN